MSPRRPSVRLSVGLDLQEAYDNARSLESMWRAAADNLEEDSVVCDHPPGQRTSADDAVPAICKLCDRVVPAWALWRDQRDGDGDEDWRASG